MGECISMGRKSSFSFTHYTAWVIKNGQCVKVSKTKGDFSVNLFLLSEIAFISALHCKIWALNYFFCVRGTWVKCWRIELSNNNGRICLEENVVDPEISVANCSRLITLFVWELEGWNFACALMKDSGVISVFFVPFYLCWLPRYWMCRFFNQAVFIHKEGCPKKLLATSLSS